MWPFRSRLDLIAHADATALARLMGDAALDYARQQARFSANGCDDGMWPEGHWSRIRREIRVVLDWPWDDQGARRCRGRPSSTEPDTEARALSRASPSNGATL